MIDSEEDLEEFLFRIKNKDAQALNKLLEGFKIEINGIYNQRIRGRYEERYYSDYIGEVNLRIYKATINFRGNNVKAFNAYIKKTIENTAIVILKSMCVYQYKFQSIETLSENRMLNFSKSNILNVEEYVVNKLLFIETTKYLKKVLKKENLELFIRTSVYGETIKQFAARKKHKYESIRSVKSRVAKKLRECEVIKELYKGVVK